MCMLSYYQALPRHGSPDQILRRSSELSRYAWMVTTPPLASANAARAMFLIWIAMSATAQDMDIDCLPVAHLSFYSAVSSTLFSRF
ncbi:hypothetical protein I7I50_07211 [Histoplasma capsulatum G186AR]|uniref:Uncharacterized protein n=1 Tax=Ajellomyces capsulatus TaxID=5037 RepID=A0A8H7Z087_AJECA|nr:hypothetical protein I7I52_09716 [Histoplasma capsulatum]QSS67967.1 hypothetical protein I7I50_07211 [Histoplasma capsulatum G186AR]